MESAEHATPLLDLFSTTQTTDFVPRICIHKAPYICIPGEGKDARLYQGCCNDWLCPRCGELRAKYEYGRIVEGARKLSASNKLYMLTVTCRGDISVEKSEAGYLEWTNRLNTNIAACSKRVLGTKPEYAAVIERQDRGHLHTHYITSFCPPDAFYITDEYERYCKNVEILNRSIPDNMRFSPEPLKGIDNRQMFSLWLCLAAVDAGLGVQIRMAVCDVIEGASRYIAKYLFKTLSVTQFPKGLRRVRYSRGWPKLPVNDATSAFPVLSAYDWSRVAGQGGVECFGASVYDKAIRWQVFQAYYKDKEGNIIDPSDNRQTVY